MTAAIPTSQTGSAADAPLSAAVNWCAGGRGVALATVIRAWGDWGSVPCPVGSQLAVDDGGKRAGSLPGGLVEDFVAREALRVIAEGEPRLLGTDASLDGAGEAGPVDCGRIELLVLPVGRGSRSHDLLVRVLRLRAEGRPVALVTDLVTGLQSLVFESLVHGGFGLDGPELASVTRLLAEGRSALVEVGEDGHLFVRVYGGGSD